MSVPGHESFSRPGFIRFEPPEADSSPLEALDDLEVVEMKSPGEDRIVRALFQRVQEKPDVVLPERGGPDRVKIRAVELFHIDVEKMLLVPEIISKTGFAGRRRACH